MALIDLKEVTPIELIPGYHVRFVHSDQMTIANWQIEQDAALPEHSHPHEQILNLISGDFELTVDGTVYHLTPGCTFVLPGGVSHGGRAITPCHIIDVFHPVREDYRDRS
jgi:quercetin dioxygenase-like cupin family protein